MIHVRKRVLKLVFLALNTFAIFFFTSCEKETDNVSKVTFYPKMTLLGSKYVSIISPGPYVEAGATATENGAPINVTIEGTVDVNTPGLYTLRYIATNSDGYSGSLERYVAVTAQDVSGFDLSGTYKRTSNNALNKLTKLANGLYQMDNVGGVLPPSALILPVLMVHTSATTIKVDPQVVAVGGELDCIQETITPNLTQFSYVVIHPNFGVAVRTFVKQ